MKFDGELFYSNADEVLIPQNLAHRIISAGGEFRVRYQEDCMVKEKFPKLILKRFKQIEEAKPWYYNVPWSRNFQSMDTFVPPNRLFQITVSSSIPWNQRTSIGKSTAKLPCDCTIDFYFVTLLKMSKVSKRQKLGDAWSDRVHHKVVGIELKDEVMVKNRKHSLDEDESEQLKKNPSNVCYRRNEKGLILLLSIDSVLEVHSSPSV